MSFRKPLNNINEDDMSWFFALRFGKNHTKKFHGLYDFPVISNKIKWIFSKWKLIFFSENSVQKTFGLI